MAPIRILLANHQPIVRSGLRLLLEREKGFRVVAEAANGREVIVLSDYKQPDITLLDVKLPLVSGIDVARQLSAKAKSPGPVFVTTDIDQSYVNEAFRAGARGYVDSDSAPGDLSNAVRMVMGGGTFLSPTICMQLLDWPLRKGSISEDDRHLWCLIAAGHDEETIAAIMKTDVNSVRMESRSLRSLFCRNILPEALTQRVFTKDRL